jgi:hypothetical protein
MIPGKRRASNLSETLICRCPEALADAIERAAAAELIAGRLMPDVRCRRRFGVTAS